MVNQQKGAQQETAYSAVVVNDHMYPRPYIVFDPKGVIINMKNDIGMDGDTFTTTAVSCCTPFCYHYPPSFHEMIFTLVCTTSAMSPRQSDVLKSWYPSIQSQW